MFTDTDYDKLRQIMAQNPENEALLQKLLASHKQTISTISHEIRNPLTLIYSTLQLLESQHPQLTSYAHWNALQEDVEYMKQLLEELSSFNNGDRLSFSDFSFKAFMEQLAVSFAASLIDSHIEFTSRIAPDLPMLCADRVKLKEVFLNLLRNACEAAGDGGTIRLDAFCQDSMVIVTITDSGCGIRPEYMDDLFSPFVTHKEGGTGLGLAIAKRTVDAHKGQIHVESSVGAGTTFTVTLPVQ